MRHSIGNYPANWAQIAVAVKEAAGWRCVRCGLASRIAHVCSIAVNGDAVKGWPSAPDQAMRDLPTWTPTKRAMAAAAIALCDYASASPCLAIRTLRAAALIAPAAR